MQKQINSDISHLAGTSNEGQAARVVRHTPTPWEFSLWHSYDNAVISAPGIRATIAECFYQPADAFNVPDGMDAQANAEFIIRACNAHDALVKALQTICDKTIDSDARKVATAALAQVAA
jgi:hypothetical protein